MRNRTIRFAALALLTVCLFSQATPSQVRHRRSTTRQNNAKTQQLSPLAPDQKKFVADLIEQAKSMDLTYQTDPYKFATATDTFMFVLGSDEIKTFPEGPIKTYLVGMIYGYRDAGELWGMLTHTGFPSTFYEAQAATHGIDQRSQRIEEIGKRWNINVMQVGLNQAQRKIFNNASNLKKKLISLLARTPTLSTASSDSTGSDMVVICGN